MTKKVAIIGVGALGSHVAMLLRNEAAMRLVDFDRLEVKNLYSQFHSRFYISRYKVDALKSLLDANFGVRNTSAKNVKLTGLNVEQMFGGCDLVIDCMDNAEGRSVAQHYARMRKVPLLHGALAADGGFGRVVWDENFKIDGDASGGATCENGDHLPFIAVVSACVARAAQVFLRTGKKDGFEIAPTCDVVST